MEQACFCWSHVHRLSGEPLQVLHGGATSSVSLAQVTYVAVQKVDGQNEGKQRDQLVQTLQSMKRWGQRPCRFLLPFSPEWWEHNVKIGEVLYCPAAIIKNKNTQTVEKGICIREDLHHGYICAENPQRQQSSFTAVLFCLPATMTN